MLIINSLKPFYKNSGEKIIRMGNFKGSAKELKYTKNELLELFRLVETPIERNELIHKMKNKFHLSENEINRSLDYLIKENFITEYEQLEKVINSGYLNRQNLFFSMVSEKTKIWNLKKQPTILILGLGGIGSNVCYILSRAGFSNFILVDHDSVEETNLIRQFPYSNCDVGKDKASVLAKKINCKNTRIINRKILNERDIEDEIVKADFVICTLDKPTRIIRRIINKLCVKHNKPVIFSGFSEHVAMIGPFVVPSQSACLKCIEKETSSKPLNNVKIVPSYGPLCLLISSIVSNEVINYCLKFNSNNLIGKTLMLNILTYEINIINWSKKKKCEVCSINDSK